MGFLEFFNTFWKFLFSSSSIGLLFCLVGFSLCIRLFPFLVRRFSGIAVSEDTEKQFPKWCKSNEEFPEIQVEREDLGAWEILHDILKVPQASNADDDQ